LDGWVGSTTGYVVSMSVVSGSPKPSQKLNCSNCPITVPPICVPVGGASRPRGPGGGPPLSAAAPPRRPRLRHPARHPTVGDLCVFAAVVSSPSEGLLFSGEDWWRSDWSASSIEWVEGPRLQQTVKEGAASRSAGCTRQVSGGLGRTPPHTHRPGVHLRVPAERVGRPPLTDGALVALGSGCPRLREVRLYGCDRLTDTGVAALAGACRSLHGGAPATPLGHGGGGGGGVTYPVAGVSLGRTDGTRMARMPPARKWIPRWDESSGLPRPPQPSAKKLLNVERWSPPGLG